MNRYAKISCILCILILPSCNSNDLKENVARCSEKQIIKLEHKYISLLNDKPMEALVILDSLIACDSKVGQRYAEKASLLDFSTNYDLAIENYDSSLVHGYDSLLIYFNRAILHSRQRDVEKAFNDINQLRKLNTKDTTDLLQVSLQVNMHLGRYQKALNISDSLLTRLSDISHLYQIRSYARLQLGDTVGYCIEIKTYIKKRLATDIAVSEEELLALCK